MGAIVTNETANWLANAKKKAEPVRAENPQGQQFPVIKLLKVTAVDTASASAEQVSNPPYRYLARVFNAMWDTNGNNAPYIAHSVPLWSYCEIGIGSVVHAVLAYGHHWETLFVPDCGTVSASVVPSFSASTDCCPIGPGTYLTLTLTGIDGIEDGTEVVLHWQSGSYYYRYALIKTTHYLFSVNIDTTVDPDNPCRIFEVIINKEAQNVFRYYNISTPPFIYTNSGSPTVIADNQGGNGSVSLACGQDCADCTAEYVAVVFDGQTACGSPARSLENMILKDTTGSVIPTYYTYFAATTWIGGFRRDYNDYDQFSAFLESNPTAEVVLYAIYKEHDAWSLYVNWMQGNDNKSMFLATNICLNGATAADNMIVSCEDDVQTTGIDYYGGTATIECGGALPSVSASASASSSTTPADCQPPTAANSKICYLGGSYWNDAEQAGEVKIYYLDGNEAGAYIQSWFGQWQDSSSQPIFGIDCGACPEIPDAITFGGSGGPGVWHYYSVEAGAEVVISIAATPTGSTVETCDPQTVVYLGNTYSIDTVTYVDPEHITYEYTKVIP